MIVETDRLILRRPEGRDWPQARDFFMSERSKTLGGPLSEDDAFRQLATEIGHWEIRGFGMWIVTRKGDDTALGLIGPWCPPDWPETEIGWMIWDADIEGTGIATEAACAAIRDAYARLGWETVVHYIDPENTRSIALAEKLGARRDDAAPRIPGKQSTLVYRSPVPEGLTRTQP